MKTLRSNWSDAILVCAKCSKKLDGGFGPKGKTPLAKALRENEGKIVEELAVVQGKPADIGGYYKPDTEKTTAVMRPSATHNAILQAASAA